MSYSTLERLALEILCEPPHSALPCNLSDDLLNLVQRDLDRWRCRYEQAGGMEFPLVPLTLALHLLVGESNGCGRAMPLSELGQFLEEYGAEVRLERLKRLAAPSPIRATQVGHSSTNDTPSIS